MSDSAWIETFTGKKFHILDPQPEEICIRDIAHALSNQCRWTGHVRQFYSVAEHSVNVSYLSGKTPIEKLSGLMHDASEAYLSDLARPVKHCTPIGNPYFDVENRIMIAIANKLHFYWPPTQQIKDADNILLYAEKAALMTGLSWKENEKDWEAEPIKVPDTVRLQFYIPFEAEQRFLERFRTITEN
jgi:hypothetical protein